MLLAAFAIRKGARDYITDKGCSKVPHAWQGQVGDGAGSAPQRKVVGGLLWGFVVLRRDEQQRAMDYGFRAMASTLLNEKWLAPGSDRASGGADGAVPERRHEDSLFGSHEEYDKIDAETV
jgi:hypothetical protein